MKKRWRRTWRSRAVVTVAGVASVAGGAVVISQIPVASAKTPTVVADEAVTTPTTAVLGQSKQSATAPAASGSTKKSSGASSSSSGSASGRVPVAPPQSTSSGS